MAQDFKPMPSDAQIISNLRSGMMIIYVGFYVSMVLAIIFMAWLCWQTNAFDGVIASSNEAVQSLKAFGEPLQPERCSVQFWTPERGWQKQEIECHTVR